MKTRLAHLLGHCSFWPLRPLSRPALLGALLAVGFSLSLNAAPFDKLIDFTQPDGTLIRLHGRGDEFSARFETLDGYTVVFDQAQQAYCFARQNPAGHLVSTGVLAHRGSPAALGLAKGLRASNAVRKQLIVERYRKWELAMQLKQRWAALKEASRPSYGPGGSSSGSDRPQPAPPPTTTTGLKVGLTLLVDFSDDPATVPQAEIIDFCNGDNYSGYGNNGSVKQYFFDNSAGLLTYTNVVTIYIRAPQAKTVYNDTTKDCGEQGNLLIKEVIETMKALPNYNSEILPTFDALTVDNNNQVIACNVFYAGGNGGVWMYGLWPHSWSLYVVGAQELSPAGKKVWRYQITDIGSTLGTGTFCHENGHMLCGFPDLYDYEYDSAGGAGSFSLMGSGGSDHNPVQIDAYLKRAAGWATTTELSAFSSLLASVSAAGPNFNHFFRFQKPGVPTEYFLVENRQKIAHDALLPGSGIAIWHVDELGDRDNQSLLYNSVHANYELTLVQADNLWHLQQNDNGGDAQDLYYLGNPAAGYPNRFSDPTAPSARWWDGSASGLLFTDFSANGPEMTFYVGAPAAAAVVIYTNFVADGNGNGVVDPNECNSLSLVLTNAGQIPATDLHATLSTITPEVFIAQAASVFPDIPPGGSAVNRSPFRISTSPAFVCGTPIDFVLILKSDAGTATNTFRLSTGVAGVPLRYDSTNAPLVIPDAVPDGAYSSVFVNNLSSAIHKITVSLQINHDRDADLLLELISPEGITNVLSRNNGTTGRNYGLNCAPDSLRTTFDDDALTSVAAAIPPWAGSFRPDQPLSVFSGKSGTNVNGTWRLHLVDRYGPYTGLLQCWSLIITPAACADGGGECPGSDLALGMSATPEPALVGSFLTFSISVTNNGPGSAKAASVTQLLPPDLAFVSAFSSQGTCSQAGGVVTCNLGGMPAGAKATITVTTRPSSPGTFFSTATVASEQPDFDPLNNSVTVASRVNPRAADLAVGIVAAPIAPLAGATFSYHVSLTNYGPSSANNVVLTNILPASLTLLSASSSSGPISVVGNVVRCSFGTLPANARVAATFLVSPTAEGPLTATSLASATENDPLPANNVASVTTTVGPASDLVLAAFARPNPAVQDGRLTYTLTVSNQGPSTASAVALEGSLPDSVIINSNFFTQGSVFIDGTRLTGDLGSLPGGASASVVLYGTATANGTNPVTIFASFVASAPQADTNSANNSVSVATVVAPPFINIIPADVVLRSESFSPPNGAIDIGETVTAGLYLRNVGNVSATPITATLLAGEGITPIPPVSRLYEHLDSSGRPVGQDFTFTVTGSSNGSAVAWLHLQDSRGYSTNVSFTFALPRLITSANTNQILIPDSGRATNYPSVINVAGITGDVAKVTATLHGFTHTYPRDVNVLLVSPAGTKTLLLAHAGGGFNPPYAVSNIDLTFDDSAASPLPESVRLAAGTWLPTAYNAPAAFPADAPAGPYPLSFSAFNGVDPTGPWSLYVWDDSFGDQGRIATGWSLSFTTVFPVTRPADLGLSVAAAPSPVRVGDTLAYTFTITNSGPDAAGSVLFSNLLPAAVSFVSAASSLGDAFFDGSLLTVSIPRLPAGTNATVTLTVSPTPAAAGNGSTAFLTNSAAVYSLATDLHAADNTASCVVAVNPQPADIALGLSAPTTVVVGSNFTYSVFVTNSGPGAAFNVTLTNPLPPALALVTNGSLAGTNLVCSFPSIPAGATACTTLVLQAVSPDSLTCSGFVSLPGAQLDPSLANNSAALPLSLVTPSVTLVLSGVALASESFSPPNGVVDPGETVTVQFSLQNLGTVPSGSITATLLPAGNVNPLSPAQSYGVLTNSPVARRFTFSAGNLDGGALVANLQLQDGSGFTTNVAFAFISHNSWTSSGPLSIARYGAATPYPSLITVSNLEGVVSKVTVSLNGLTHSFPSDVNALLVSPAGSSVLLMSHAGGAYSLNSPVTLTFEDSAASPLPYSSLISSGTYRPSQFGAAPAFLAPAPQPPYGCVLAAANHTDPNGPWALYLFDDSPGDGGDLAGWSLSLTTVNALSPVADLAVSMTASSGLALQSSTVTYTLTVTNLGPDADPAVVLQNTLPEGFSVLSTSASQGAVSASGSVLTCNLGALPAGAAATITIVASPTLLGTFANAATVAGGNTDLNSVNNSVSASIRVIKEARLTALLQNGMFNLTVVGNPDTLCTIQSSTNLVHWDPISAARLPSDGTLTFPYTNNPSIKALFYRAVYSAP